MPEKRKKAPSSSEPGDDSPYAKRSRSQSFYADGYGINDDHDEEEELAPSLRYAHERPRNDPIYGQKSAFPGLDDPNAADELFYGPAEDGIEYLRMVR